MEGKAMEIKIIRHLSKQQKLWFTANGIVKSAQFFTHNGKNAVYLLPEAKICSQKEFVSLFKAAQKEEKNLTQIISPLTGSLVKIFVSIGQKVMPGDPIALIESMKMENEIRAFIPAIIQTIPITQGSVIQKSQVLVTQTPITPQNEDEVIEKETLYGNHNENVKTQIQDW